MKNKIIHSNTQALKGEGLKKIQGTQAISVLLKNITLHAGQSLVSQVFSLLKDLIVTIQLRPGQLISEKEIAEALQASKTPVREALIRLEDIGLVNIIPKSGTYVTQIQIDRYLEACFVRLQLEMGAVRNAAQNHNSKDTAFLTDLVHEQEKALSENSQKLFFQLDEQLHQSFFELAGVGGVWDSMKRSQSEVDRMRHLKRIFNIRRGAQVIEDHKTIVAAIQKGAPMEAEAALVNHIGSLEREIEELSSHPVLLDYIETLNTTRPRTRSKVRTEHSNSSAL